MLSATDLKVGKKIIYEGSPCEILKSEHLKVAMGKGLQKVTLKDLISGSVMPKTMREVDKFEEADITMSTYEYLYNDGESYYFMNQSSFEQITLPKNVVGDAKYFLCEGDKVMLQEFNGTPININLEASVTLEVTDTPPGERGDTATGGKKPATLSTGLVVQVPLFMAIGEKVRVDTRTHEYLGRAGN